MYLKCVLLVCVPKIRPGGGVQNLSDNAVSSWKIYHLLTFQKGVSGIIYYDVSRPRRAYIRDARSTSAVA